MSTVFDIVVAIALGLPAVVLLFLGSTVFFDVVHWILHRMLASRSGALRALAWPHGIHHQWIDRRLRINWEYQWANVFCHLVLEYLTQLTFTALLALLLPRGLVIGLAGMQTLVFLMLLRERGLDLNHRAQPVVEVAQPAVYCPVAYHAQHHAHPDAYFSSYVKLVDVVLGTALDLPSLRVGLLGGDSAFGRAFRERLCASGAGEVVALEASDERDDVDVLVLCEPALDLAAEVERYLEANGRRQLPPEVWAVIPTASDAVARHYYRDRRLLFRPIVLPDGIAGDEAALARAARTAFRWIVRGAHLPWTRGVSPSLGAWKKVSPETPAGVPKIRRRAEALGAA